MVKFICSIKNIKILFLIFIFSTLFLLRFALSQDTRTNYYAKVDLYPLEGKNIDELSKDLLFKGYSEIEFFSYIQKTYFYAIPAVKTKTEENSPGAYKIIEDKNKNRITIALPRSGFKVIILFKYLKKEKTVSSKYTFFENKLIDEVKYIYKNDHLHSAKSELYGIKYFQKPGNIFEKVKRKLIDLWYAYF